MKKVLILTVIAILALGVMAMAGAAASGNSNLPLTGTFNITVQQWIDGTLSAKNITFGDYGTGIEKDLFTLSVQSNAAYKIFMADLTDLPQGISVSTTSLPKLYDVTNNATYDANSSTIDNKSGYLFEYTGNTGFSPASSYGKTKYKGKVYFNVLNSTEKAVSGSISLDVTIIAEANF